MKNRAEPSKIFNSVKCWRCSQFFLNKSLYRQKNNNNFQYFRNTTFSFKASRGIDLEKFSSSKPYTLFNIPVSTSIKWNSQRGRATNIVVIIRENYFRLHNGRKISGSNVLTFTFHFSRGQLPSPTKSSHFHPLTFVPPPPFVVYTTL